MSNNQIDNSDNQPKKPLLEPDERIALIVTFLALGGILWWLWQPKLSSFSWQKQGLSFGESEQTEKISKPKPKNNTLPPFPQPNLELPGILTNIKQPQATKTKPKEKSEKVQVSIFDRLRAKADSKTTTEESISQPVDINIPAFPQAQVPIIIQPQPNQKPLTPKQNELELAFNDVSPDYWAYPFIAALLKKGIISNVSTKNFQPDAPVTRAELAALISQAFEVNNLAQTKTLSFKDVAPTDAFKSEIEQAISKGFMKGYPEGVFRPEQPVPRYQVLVALATGLNLKATQKPDELLKNYTDIDSLPNWAREKIAAATEAGIVVNYPDLQKLEPNRPATKAEVAAMLYQALVKTQKFPPIASQYVVKPQREN